MFSHTDSYPKDNRQPCPMATSNIHVPSLLVLPAEIRIHIYKHLLCVKLARVQKPWAESTHSTSRYFWGLQPAILATCRQIHDEAKDVLRHGNSFIIVECATRRLQKTKADRACTSPADFTLWPAKSCAATILPRATMRIQFHLDAQYQGRNKPRSTFHVVHEDEVKDLCAALSTYRDRFYRYEFRLSRLSMKVEIDPLQLRRTSESCIAQEWALLRDLLPLGHVKTVTFERISSNLEHVLTNCLCLQAVNPSVVCFSTVKFLSSGDEAYDIGHFLAADGWYARAWDYFHHCQSQRLFNINLADSVVLHFMLTQRRARVWLEMRKFSRVRTSSNINIDFANGNFLTHEPKFLPKFGDPPDQVPVLSSSWSDISHPMMAEHDNLASGHDRTSHCEQFKEAAKRFEQRIKCEDIGRCYMYRSIANRYISGLDDAQAADDRLMALECCKISNTADPECFDELEKLESRILRKSFRHSPPSKPGAT